MIANELNFYLLGTAIVLFHIGMLGLVLNRGNILKTIMSLEILLLSINLNFITFSLYLDDIVGYIFVFFINIVVLGPGACPEVCASLRSRIASAKLASSIYIYIYIFD